MFHTAKFSEATNDIVHELIDSLKCKPAYAKNRHAKMAGIRQCLSHVMTAAATPADSGQSAISEMVRSLETLMQINFPLPELKLLLDIVVDDQHETLGHLVVDSLISSVKRLLPTMLRKDESAAQARRIIRVLLFIGRANESLVALAPEPASRHHN